MTAGAEARTKGAEPLAIASESARLEFVLCEPLWEAAVGHAELVEGLAVPLGETVEQLGDLWQQK